MNTKNYFVMVNGETLGGAFRTDHEAAQSQWQAVKDGQQVRTWNGYDFIEWRWTWDPVLGAIIGHRI